MRLVHGWRKHILIGLANHQRNIRASLPDNYNSDDKLIFFGVIMIMKQKQ